MKTTEYRCAARPPGNGGQVCGAAPREHNAKQPYLKSPVTGALIAQHKFIAEAVNK